MLITKAFRFYLFLLIFAFTFVSSSFAAQSQNNTQTQQPNEKNQKILTFASKAAIAAFTYNYKDYNEQFKNLAGYFTPEGWKAFTKALEKSQNVTAVIQAKLTVTAKETGKASIINEKNQQEWTVEVPIEVFYTDKSKQTLTHQMKVTLRIKQFTQAKNPYKLGIDQFIAAPVEGTTKFVIGTKR